MKKIIVLAFVLTMGAAWPTSVRAADDCGCAAGDVACINSCTLSKITTLRKNIQSQKEAALAKIQAAKTAAEANTDAKAQLEEAKANA